MGLHVLKLTRRCRSRVTANGLPLFGERPGTGQEAEQRHAGPPAKSTIASSRLFALRQCDGARLSGDPGVTILRTNMDAGHGGASGRFDRLHETAFAMAFALKVVGLSH